MNEADNGLYGGGFFEHQIHGSIRSAQTLVPRIIELVPEATSVVDVGCGAGGWLAEYERRGVEDIFGIDGFLPVDTHLQIPKEKTELVDLSQPYEMPRRFDIAQSLEVAEHIRASSADQFVKLLADASDFVVFGAAAPNQGGTAHINENWLSYWCTRFAERGYEMFDIIRPLLWDEVDIEWWYAQNTVVFAKSERTDLCERLRAIAATIRHPRDIVHPNALDDWRKAADRAMLQASRQSILISEQSALVAEQTSRISEQSILILELSTRASEQSTRLSEQAALLSDQSDRLSEQSTLISEQATKLEEALSGTSLAVPRRFRNREYVKKLLAEKSTWKKVAMRHPFRIQYWRDVARVERRKSRLGK